MAETQTRPSGKYRTCLPARGRNCAFEGRLDACTGVSAGDAKTSLRSPEFVRPGSAGRQLGSPAERLKDMGERWAVKLAVW